MKKNNNKINVLLVDDCNFTRKAIRGILAKHHNIHILAEAENGVKAVQLAKKLKPDVVVMDIEMPVMDGIEATRKIVENNSEIKIIGFSTSSNRDNITKIQNAGASSCVAKDHGFIGLPTIIEAVVCGNCSFGLCL